MDEHCVDGDLLRHGEEKFVEGTDHDSRVLGQVNDFLHRLGRKLGNKSRLRLDGFHLFADRRFTFRFARNDEIRPQHIDKIVGGGNIMRTRREEAMSESLGSSSEASKLDRHHRFTKHGQKPAYRTAELLAPAAPSLRLGPLDARDDRSEQIGKQACNVNGRSLFDSIDVFYAVLVTTLERCWVDALAPGKTDGGLRGLTILVKGDFCRWSTELLDGCFGALGNVCSKNDQTTGRRVDVDLSMGDLRPIKRLSGNCSKLGRCIMKVKCRQLFGADFECECLIRHLRPPSHPARYCRRHARYSLHSTLWRLYAHARCNPCALLQK